MNLQKYNLRKRFRAVERLTLATFNHLHQIRGAMSAMIRTQNLHTAQLANLNARITVLEAMLNVTPNDSSYRFGIVKRPDA